MRAPSDRFVSPTTPKRPQQSTTRMTENCAMVNRKRSWTKMMTPFRNPSNICCHLRSMQASSTMRCVRTLRFVSSSRPPLDNRLQLLLMKLYAHLKRPNDRMWLLQLCIVTPSRTRFVGLSNEMRYDVRLLSKYPTYMGGLGG